MSSSLARVVAGVAVVGVVFSTLAGCASATDDPKAVNAFCTKLPDYETAVRLFAYRIQNAIGGDPLGSQSYSPEDVNAANANVDRIRADLAVLAPASIHQAWQDLNIEGASDHPSLQRKQDSAVAKVNRFVHDKCDLSISF